MAIAAQTDDADAQPSTIQGSNFPCPTKYELGNKIGEGAYAVVWEAIVQETGESVAIKKIDNALECLKFAKCVLRELRILRHLQHENIIRVRDVFINKSKHTFRDVFITTELLESDLGSILKSSQELTNSHVQFFFYQILRGLKYLHSAGVMHRDLKPRNLLVNCNCDLKICDFGLSRVYYDDREFEIMPLTDYVCTRWYRPPEVLSCRMDYTSAVDIWSAGCVLAEMLGRKALFQGLNTQHQWSLMTNILGSPTETDLARILTPQSRIAFESIPEVEGVDFASIYPNATADSLSILRKMLRWNPDNRVTATEALDHRYVDHLHNVRDEPSRDPLPRAEFEFERRKLSAVTVREELFHEILHYHPSLSEDTEDTLFSITDCGLLTLDAIEEWECECPP